MVPLGGEESGVMPLLEVLLSRRWSARANSPIGWLYFFARDVKLAMKLFWSSAHC
jgi:hypothetical protein